MKGEVRTAEPRLFSMTKKVCACVFVCVYRGGEDGDRGTHLELGTIKTWLDVVVGRGAVEGPVRTGGKSD